MAYTSQAHTTTISEWIGNMFVRHLKVFVLYSITCVAFIVIFSYFYTDSLPKVVRFYQDSDEVNQGKKGVAYTASTAASLLEKENERRRPGVESDDSVEEEKDTSRQQGDNLSLEEVSREAESEEEQKGNKRRDESEDSSSAEDSTDDSSDDESLEDFTVAPMELMRKITSEESKRREKYIEPILPNVPGIGNYTESLEEKDEKIMVQVNKMKKLMEKEEELKKEAEKELKKTQKHTEKQWNIFIKKDNMKLLPEDEDPSIIPPVDLPYITRAELDISFSESGTGPYVNMLDQDSPPFLPEYKNPCWREELPSSNIYDNNYMLRYEEIDRTTLHKMTDNAYTYEKRVTQGINYRLRCLPYFYVAGFVKCGTTEIYSNIRNHPMIVHSKKEIHWWTRYRNLVFGHPGTAEYIRDYIDIFDRGALEIENTTIQARGMRKYHPLIIGDGSTVTASQQRNWWKHPENRGRIPGYHAPRFHNADYIHHVSPEARIIIAMRNPADRLYSQFYMHHGRGPNEFHVRAEAYVDFMKKCISEHDIYVCTAIPLHTSHYRFSMTDSLYFPHVEHWMKAFPRNQLYFMDLKEYGRDKLKVTNEICEFLGLELMTDDMLEKTEHHIHIGCENCTIKPMLPKTRNILMDFFRPYNQMLADLLHDKKFLYDE